MVSLKPLTVKEQLEYVVRDLKLDIAPNDEALMMTALILLKSHPEHEHLRGTIGEIFAQIQRRDQERDRAFLEKINAETT